MKRLSSVLSGMGSSLVVAAAMLGGCGGDKSAPPGGTGGATTDVGGSGNDAGNAGVGGSSNAGVGGSNTAGGATAGGGSSHLFDWNFYQDSSGWQTGTWAQSGTSVMTVAVANVQGQTYCSGGCADVTITTTPFDATDSQSVNFMYYWSTLPDFTGRTLTALVKLDDPNGIVQVVQLHAQNGSPGYTWSTSATVSPTSTPSMDTLKNSTTAVTLTAPVTPTDASSTFDPSLVQGIGFNISANATGSGTAHLYVDEVIVD